VIQNASTILLLRYVRTVPGDMFFSTTAIVCQEFIKMITSALLIYCESFSVSEFVATVDKEIVHNKLDSIKTGIPALLYTIQNNLIYLAISNLDAAVFQVTVQIKILTTAIFMVIMLNRSLKPLQWFSLFILFVGVSIIQIQNVKSGGGESEAQKNAIFGLFCVILACVLSGLAGVYFEKILKNSKTSIWVRNIQLGLFGTLFSLLTAYGSDWEGIKVKGFFFGYNYLVWINILVQSAGGLLVAVVIKYADNILKGFATSVAIIVSCIASVYLFNTDVNYLFTFGTFLVTLSVFFYSYTPKTAQLPLVNPSLSSSTQALSLSSQSTRSPKSESDLSLLQMGSEQIDPKDLIRYGTTVVDINKS
jgi:UDP-sugar transporter A1/2/3